MKYGSDNGFFDFLRHGGGHIKAIALLLCGVLLILLASGGRTEDTGEMSREEALGQMCSSIDGVGECKVMISYDGDEVYAVAVACVGGDSVEVKQCVSELISSLYGIGYNRISVMKISDK